MDTPTFKEFISEISDIEISKQQSTMFTKQERRDRGRMTDQQLQKQIKMNRAERKQDTRPLAQKILRMEAQLAQLRKQLAIQDKREGTEV